MHNSWKRNEDDRSIDSTGGKKKMETINKKKERWKDTISKISHRGQSWWSASDLAASGNAVSPGLFVSVPATA